MKPHLETVRQVSRRIFLKWMGKTASLLSVVSVFGSGVLKPGTIKAAALAPTTGAVKVLTGGEFLLKNGTIVDGTGSKAFTGDLLIDGERIAAVSESPIEAGAEVIDCGGKVIAPGFIDMHSHMDWVLPVQGYHQLKTPFTCQGITTFVTGNCGYGVAGFRKDSQFRSMINARTYDLYAMDWDTMAEYFDVVSRQGITHNMLNLAGHGTTRTSIAGFSPDPMKGDNLKEMLYLLEESMEQGAQGVSLGLQYEPGIFAKKPEMKAVAELVKRKDKILTVHMKAYSSLSGTYPLEFFGTPHNLLGIQDMLDLARETGVRTQLSHLIFVGERTWKNYGKALDMIEKARQEGLDVKFDTYAYHCGTSIINVVMPEWFLANVPENFESRTALLKLRAELTLIKNLLGFGYEDIQITKANHPELEQYNGMFLKDIAEQRGKSEFENFIDFARMSKGRSRVLNHRYSNLEQVLAMIRHPASLIQTDATMALEGTQNPGCFGNFPRVLQYTREHKLLSLEAIVKKMTADAADRFQIKDRGLLKEGLAADITVFDWNTVRDNNTDTETDRQPTGIERVFINGQPVMTAGNVDTGLLPGRVLL